MFYKIPHLLCSLFLLAFTMVPSFIFAQSCPEGMTHYWEFNDQSGTTFSDRNGTDAICSSQVGINCPTFLDNISQIGASCLFFNSASSQGAEIPSNASFDWGAGDSFTIEFWIAMDKTSFTDNVVIIARDDRVTENGVGVHWWIGVEGDPSDGTTNDGTIRFQLRAKNNNSAAPFMGGKGPKINDGNWHHIVAVRDGNKGENIIYIDGSEVDKQNFSYATDFSSSAPITIGYLDSNVSSERFFYDGPLDELAIYNRALTISEISDHANNRKTYCSIDLVGNELTEQVSLFKLFPNPVNEREVKLFLKNETFGKFDINIYALNGTLLFTDSFIKKEKSKTHYLELEQLAKGVYVLEIISQNFTKREKFFKK